MEPAGMGKQAIPSVVACKVGQEVQVGEPAIAAIVLPVHGTHVVRSELLVVPAGQALSWPFV